MSTGQTSSFTGFNINERFNNRLQPSEIKASSSAGTAIDITYNFVDPASQGNAGHVYGITNKLKSGRSQAFTYDQVNRILSAGTTATTGTYCWGYQYSYDVWGNLLSQAGWTPTYNGCTETTMGTVTADGSNHISTMSYDASGNAQSDGLYSYTWDAESQMKTANGVTYAYDGDGRRAAKVGSKLYWYGSGGEILAETDASGNTLNEYVFFGGKRVALVPASGAVLYYAEDMLGSSRVMVQANGTLCYDADFTPFGGERAYTSTCAQNYKFEGKERDAETQNDDFGAREYSWRFGRWLSSDWSAVPAAVPYANLTNPQTLNLYSMVGDDPESFADADGHEVNANTQPPSPSCTSSTSSSCPRPVSNQVITFAQEGALGDLGLLYLSATVAAQNQPQQQTQQTQQQDQTQQPTSGHLNINWDAVLKKTSDFSAGAGDCLTGSCIPFVHGSLTQLARGDADSVVDKKSLAYKGGEVTGGAVGSALLSAGGATLAALADGKNGALFGRGLNTVFNSSKVRFGWGWQGSATAGQDVIRLGIGAARGTSWWSHIVFWVP